MGKTGVLCGPDVFCDANGRPLVHCVCCRGGFRSYWRIPTHGTATTSATWSLL